jgi:hypothetical protein
MMKTFLLFCVAGVLLAGPAYGVKKCALPDGSVVYSDVGCPAASRVSEVESPAHRPPLNRFQLQQQERKKQLEPWLKTPWRDQIARRQISINMPAELVRLIWGEPDKINRTLTRRGAREQWVYGSIGSRQYVYIEDDKVSVIQD